MQSIKDIQNKHFIIFVSMILVFIATYAVILSSDSIAGSISNRTTAYEQNFCRPEGTRQEVCIPGSIPTQTIFATASRELKQIPNIENNYTACVLMTEVDKECESVILEARDQK